MAGIVDGLGNEGIYLFCFDPVIAKPGVESKEGKKIGNEMDSQMIGFWFRTAHNIDATGNTDPAVNSGLPGRAELHSRGQAQGIGKAVMHSADSGQRVCQGMHNAEIFLKSHRPHGSRSQHAAPGVQI